MMFFYFLVYKCLSNILVILTKTLCLFSNEQSWLASSKDFPAKNFTLTIYMLKKKFSNNILEKCCIDLAQ